MVQWLGLGTFTAAAWVQSLVGELKSCKLHGVAKKKKKEKKNKKRETGKRKKKSLLLSVCPLCARAQGSSSCLEHYSALKRGEPAGRLVGWSSRETEMLEVGGGGK